MDARQEAPRLTQHWWLRASVWEIVIAERLVLGEQRARCHEQKFFERGKRLQLRRTSESAGIERTLRHACDSIRLERAGRGWRVTLCPRIQAILERFPWFTGRRWHVTSALVDRLLSTQTPQIEPESWAIVAARWRVTAPKRCPQCPALLCLDPTTCEAKVARDERARNAVFASPAGAAAPLAGTGTVRASACDARAFAASNTDTAHCTPAETALT